MPNISFSGNPVSRSSRAVFRSGLPRQVVVEKRIRMRHSGASKMSAHKGAVRIGIAGAAFLMVSLAVFLAAFYLYQVNDIATKGYEMKELENQIQQLKKESEAFQIKEVELKSMYNIEKSTVDLNLVNSSNVAYIEMGGTVAMK